MRKNIQPIQAVVGLTIIAITVMAIAVTMLLWDLRSREIEHSRVETISLTEMLLDQTEQIIGNADLVLRSIQEKLQSSYAKQFGLNSLPVHLLLGARVAGMQQVRSLFIVSANGYVINSSRELPGSDVTATDRDYYQAFVNNGHNGLFIGKPVIGRADGEWTIHLARNLTDEQNNLIGIIVVSISLNYFENAYDFAKLDLIRPIALYMDDGTLVASSPRRNEEIGSPASELANTALPHADSEIRLHTRYRDNQRKERFTLVKAEDMPFLISVTDDEHDALSSWRETAKPIAIGSAVIGALIIIVAMRLILELQREATLN